MRRDRQPSLRHIFEVSIEGEDDDQWIPKINGGNCIVISGDQGNKHPRLPAICKEKNITHIILTSKAHASTKFERARAIVMLWPQILEAFDAPPGTRFQMGRAKSDFTLVAKDTHEKQERHDRS